MVRLDLQIACNMENLREISLPADEDWYFTTKCTHCNETSDQKIYFKLIEIQDIPGSKGQANYIAKCKFCERVSNVEYLQNSLAVYTNENNQFQTIASFECRGLELVNFYPGNSFAAIGKESGTEFGHPYSKEPIEFDGPDWAGFDEDANESVGIYEFRSQFVRSNKK